jgi:hypothetical protein
MYIYVYINIYIYTYIYIYVYIYTGDPPFASLKDIEEGKKADDPTTVTTTKNVVLADGMLYIYI